MNLDNENIFKKQMVKCCKALYKKDMLAAADGNISLKIDDNRILITPSGVMKSKISISEIAIVDIEGSVISGKPSSELSMHLAIYRKCSKARAVVHAHPPHAIAWTVAKPSLTELPAESISETILACGSIPIVPFALPSTSEMATSLFNYLPEFKVLLLARHGGLTWGEDLNEAHRGMERLEHTAKILYIAQTLNQTSLSLSPIEEQKLQKLKEMRKTMGNKTL